ncbi:NnrS family protein [Pannonibacter phragmitetus]|uniref:NnrS family protein n=1 Tax=Pannonibacter phragmitetus TaxID=121719 RepID=UPI000F01F9B7|nr:NnrS family protein [Pannonibacter phragmitetus]
MTSPHWLSGGFRPFFFLGALAMAASVLMWVPVYSGLFSLPTLFVPRDWHVHTLIFGGVMAIIAGFGLTAVANWTGRPPVSGALLLALVLLWLAGRVAVTSGASLGPLPVAALDVLFPLALTAVMAREVIAARNLRNLKIAAVIGLLALADLGFHLEAAQTGVADVSLRASLSLVILLILMIGGRIIPAFTRNWLNARKAAKLPVTFNKADAAIMVLSGAALVLWTVLPDALATAVLMLLAGAGQIWRLTRWCGFAARREPLLLILHIGHLILALGFLAVPCAALLPQIGDATASVHLWTAGAIGIMTLAVMTRASRGHSGHPLTADRLDLVIFALVILGTIARVASPHAGDAARALLDTAALAWAGAYLAFAAGYARRLLLPPAKAG